MTRQFSLLREMPKDGHGEVNDSPIEHVRLVVPITDDHTLPTFTFRTWVMGPFTCAILSFLVQFFYFRQNTIYLSASFIQLLVVVWGKMMAKTLPSKHVKVPGTSWTFSMNPGPFSIKEHVLITIMATSGLTNPYSISIVSLSKVFYRKSISYLPGLLMTLTTQLTGYGFAGLFMKLLVSSPNMWFPTSLIDVCLYRALHEEERRVKGRLSKLQFFSIATIASFAYAIVPGYFFPSIGALSLICWIWKGSVVAQIIGSGRGGFGIGAIALDWSAASGFLSNPLTLPLDTALNAMVGFLLFLYVITPIVYWSNLYDARRFPLFSYHIFDASGQVYNLSRVLNENDLTLNPEGYKSYSKPYIGTVYFLTIGCCLACSTSAITHLLLFYGRDTWEQMKLAWEHQLQCGDVHNRLMSKYERIPRWWYYAITFSMVGLAIFTCETFIKQLQLPYWGILLGCLMIIVLILPFGVLVATTGQTLNLGVISDLSMGYIYPGRPLANLVYKSFCVSVMGNALNIFYELKLGHYLKIPPKNMFTSQIIGTLITSTVSYSSTWWLISTVEHMCDVERLPKGSPWTCPLEHVTFSYTVIWGVIGPSRIFFPDGPYSTLYWFFLIGMLAPCLVWALSRLFPKRKWIKQINTPLIFISILHMPAVGPVNIWAWITASIFFNSIVFRRYKSWWSSYNYILAYGLDMGVALLTVLLSLTLQQKDIYGVNWWGLDVGDHCPLASCPTDPDVVVDGCPVSLA